MALSDPHEIRPRVMPADVETLLRLREKLNSHIIKLQTCGATRIAIVQAEDLIELIVDLAIVTAILARVVDHVAAP